MHAIQNIILGVKVLYFLNHCTSVIEKEIAEMKVNLRIFYQ
jgi:hypothetical protein